MAAGPSDKALMRQIQRTRDEVAKLREFMGESAAWATLTFPASPPAQPQEPAAVADAECGARTSGNNPWKVALTDACVVNHLGWDENDPKKTLANLVAWEIEIALDPAVSSRAQALQDATDSARLDWLARQDLDDLAFGLVVDAAHDGEYVINSGGKIIYGKTLRAAIDAAIGHDTSMRPGINPEMEKP